MSSPDSCETDCSESRPSFASHNCHAKTLSLYNLIHEIGLVNDHEVMTELENDGFEEAAHDSELVDPRERIQRTVDVGKEKRDGKRDAALAVEQME